MTRFSKGLCFAAGAILGAATLIGGLLAYPFVHVSRTERVMPRFLKENPGSERYRLLLSGDMRSVSSTDQPAIIANFPAGTLKLQAPNVRNGLAMIGQLRDRRNRPIAFATELEAVHEDSRLISGKIMTHTTWTIVIPGRGALVMYQVEDNWLLFKRFVLPGLLFGTHWQGSWKNLNTLGPSPQGYGEIIAGSGAFAGKRGHFVEFAELTKFAANRDFVGTMDLYIAPR